MQYPSNHNNTLLEKRLSALLVATWCLMQFFLFHHFGIVTQGESVKYIAEARFLDEQGHFSAPKYLFYSGYIALHWIAFKTGAGVTGIYLFQLLWNAFAMYCFYRLSNRMTGNALTAYISTGLLLLFWPFQSWTTHLYTESFFTSTIIIALYNWFGVERSRYSQLSSLLLFALLILSRPTGILFIPAALAMWVRKKIVLRQWTWLAVTAGLTIIAFLLILETAMKGEGEFDFMKPYLEEHIICGVPTQERASVNLPADGNSPAGLAYYMIHNRGQFIRLCGRKFHAFWGMTREHYSAVHNIFLMLFLYPVYLLVLFSLQFWLARERGFLLFAFTMVLLFTISVLLTCDDWLNRFIMPIIPVLFLLAAPGVHRVLSMIYRKRLDEI